MKHLKDHIIDISKKAMNKDCKTCKHTKDCANIGQFKENDCLQYEMTIRAMNEEIKKLDD